MNFILNQLESLGFNTDLFLKSAVLLAIGSVVLGATGRFVFGKRSSLNHAVSAAMGILFVYVVTVIIYTFNPVDLTRFLSPLPFATFSGERIANAITVRPHIM